MNSKIKELVFIGMGIVGIILIIAGVMEKRKTAMSISIIGGADGPTSIFLAGKLGKDFSSIGIIAGIILIVIVAIWVIISRKK